MATTEATGSLAQRMGIEVHELSAARATGTMPVDGNTQPAGLLHGGASVVLAETLGSMAATVHAGPGRAAVGIEVNATHHRAVDHGQVSATATALHLGTTVASYEVTVDDDAGRRVATVRLTCLLVCAS
ncbi:MAG: hotdog fold thioesterase [Micrococcales bacterium]|nr:hotdog fold thioesterase [Micrococcales bacterium]